MNAQDVIFLEGLEVPCRVGCTVEERRVPQSLRVEVKLFCGSISRAAQNDSLEDTVDYRLGLDLISVLQNKEFLLIERVAEVLAAEALKVPIVEQVQITVRKRPPVQGMEIVGVQIMRSRA
ncbi:MAG: dihydroneopterin aldolase [Myxococcales bacterium]|nr:dihydroneopterin aldolase [Myxococcales bacterium]